MPYGKPVSRRRRHHWKQTGKRNVTALLTARRLARRADATAHSNSSGSPTLPSPISAAPGTNPTASNPSSLVAHPPPLASPSLLCAGHRPGVWPLRERLALASGLLDADNQQLTWPTISRRLAKFTPPPLPLSVRERPKTWCSARSCAQQYALLLDSADMSRKQQVTAFVSCDLCIIIPCR